MAGISLRAGSTLTLNCVKKDSSGVEENVASVTVTATFAESSTGKTLATGSVNKTGGGAFTITLSATTTDSIGPAGMTCTIKYVYPSGAVDIVRGFPVELTR